MFTTNFSVKVNVQFDRLDKPVRKMNITSLRHAGALTRKISRQSIRYRQNKKISSTEGTPPFTHTRGRGLKNAINYEVIKEDELVRIGTSFSVLDRIGYAHEIGGDFELPRWKKARNFPQRPFMKPTLDKISPSLPKFWEGVLK